ncbi:hypochlorite-responsive transcription factor [Escherichia coli]|nr:hypochlorite-responsive transcription factor [Escherichia coli]
MDVECPQGRLTEYNVMDDCGAVLHNIETKWLYDFLTLEKCRNFSQAAVSRNVSQPAFSRRIRALEQAIGVELFNRQVTPLQLSEQGKIFHSQIRHLLQQLESNLAELRGGSDYAQRKIKIAAAHSLSLGLLPSIISQMPPIFTWAIEAIDVDEAVDKLREGQSDCIFSFHDEDLLEAPFDHIRLFESQLFPVCASDEYGEALFNLAQPHFPLLNYSRNSYMGRLINRTLTRHSELSFSTFFVSSMSELLKQVALDGCGIAWLPEYAIQQEIRSGQLVVLNRDELVIPIQAYAYRMNTRMNPVAERFWRELRELEIEPG